MNWYKRSQNESNQDFISEEEKIVSFYHKVKSLRNRISPSDVNSGKRMRDYEYLTELMEKLKNRYYNIKRKKEELMSKKANSENKLILMRGVSGSGKSTLAKRIQEEQGGKIFSTDEYFVQGDDYNFDSKQLSKAHDWNFHRVSNAMDENISPIIVDNTNTKFWEMKRYVALAQEKGYQVEFSEVDNTQEGNKGVKTDDGKWNIDFLRGRNIHGVDESILKKQIDRFDYDPDIDKVLNSKAP